MPSRSDVQAGVIIGGFDPVDFRQSHKPDLANTFDGQAIWACRMKSALQDSLFGARQRTFEAWVVERFQQVIQSARLECPQRILIIGSHEHDRGRHLRSEEFQHVKPIALRHLHIEKDQVWPPTANFGQPFHPRLAFAHNFDFRIPAQ
jgi:hypothetical protein